jgi:hypothetical protein
MRGEGASLQVTDVCGKGADNMGVYVVLKAESFGESGGVVERADHKRSRGVVAVLYYHLYF